jgi:hypothetical protein
VAVSRRVADCVTRDFEEQVQADVLDLLESTTRTDWREHGTEPGRERLHAAILKLAAGDIDALIVAAATAERDWRDVLVAAGLAEGDWPDRVAEILGETH